MSDETGGELPDRSKRIYVLWAAGFAFLGLLAMFCVYFLRPCLEVRAATGLIPQTEITPDCEDAVKSLGGPEQAAAKCALYVRLPERLASNYEKDRAFEILGACGQPAFPWLVSLLRSWDALVRANAARALGDLNDRRAVEPLIMALKDSDSDVRYSAANALRELKDRRAVEPLKELLADPDNNPRKAAEAAIREIKAPAPKR